MVNPPDETVATVALVRRPDGTKEMWSLDEVPADGEVLAVMSFDQYQVALAQGWERASR